MTRERQYGHAADTQLPFLSEVIISFIGKQNIDGIFMGFGHTTMNIFEG